MKSQTHIVSLALAIALSGCVGEELDKTGDALSVPAAEKPAEAKPAKLNKAERKAAKHAKKEQRKRVKPDPIPAPSDVAAAPADASTTASGLASKVISAGTGTIQPKKSDSVEVHYTGWTTDGEMFDSSVARGETITFPLSRVIPGWTEGVGLMVEGEQRRLWIPEELAYKGRPGAPAGMLVFDVELIKIVKPPETPEDVAAAPAEASVTDTGLASKLLKAGEGLEKPTAQSRVVVHYTGWTTDGKMFDSSVSKGRPAAFPLNGVIAGWTEGLQLMSKGEKRRFWIPEELAYQGKPGRPAGMLVFDVELIDFK